MSYAPARDHRTRNCIGVRVVVEHVLRVANVFADQLRRLHDPHKHLTVRDTFRLVPQVIPEIRPQLWHHVVEKPYHRYQTFVV